VVTWGKGRGAPFPRWTPVSPRPLDHPAHPQGAWYRSGAHSQQDAVVEHVPQGVLGCDRRRGLRCRSPKRGSLLRWTARFGSMARGISGAPPTSSVGSLEIRPADESPPSPRKAGEAPRLAKRRVRRRPRRPLQPSVPSHRHRRRLLTQQGVTRRVGPRKTIRPRSPRGDGQGPRTSRGLLLAPRLPRRLTLLD
jgi:hypothetical protein